MWITHVSREVLPALGNLVTDGRNVGNKDELIEISSENGLNKQEIRDFFQSNIGHEEVLREENRAKEMNIFSVPTYIFNKKYLLVGGQEPDTFKACLLYTSDAADE